MTQAGGVKRLSVAARVVVALEVVIALAVAARLLPVESWLRGLIDAARSARPPA